MSNINEQIQRKEFEINKVNAQINISIDNGNYKALAGLDEKKAFLWDELIELDKQKHEAEHQQQVAVLRSYNQLNQPNPDYTKPNEGMGNIVHIPHAGMWAAPAAVWGAGAFGMLRAFFF